MNKLRLISIIAAAWFSPLTVDLSFAEKSAAVSDPWKDFDLKEVKVEAGTIYIDSEYLSQEKEIIEAFKPFGQEELKGTSSLRPANIKTEEIIDSVNHVLGFTPDKQRIAKQRAILTTFHQATRITFAKPDKLRFYVVGSERIKTYLRKGGLLPGFDYNAATDQGTWSVEASRRGEIITTPQTNTLTPVVEPVLVFEAFPIIVGTNESPVQAIKKLAIQKSLDEAAVLSLGAAVHELIETTMLWEILEPADSYFRWFSDGFANAVTIHVLDDVIDRKDLAAEFGKAFDTKAYADLKTKVNLLYWRGSSYGIKTSLKQEIRITHARYAFATEEAVALIQRRGIDCVKHILDILAKRESQSGDDFVTATSQATGEDMAARLQAYQAFDTVESGVAMYEKQRTVAEEAGDQDTVLFCTIRLIELKARYGNHLRDIMKAAWLMGELGQAKEGFNLFSSRVPAAEATENPRSLDKWQLEMMKYAVRFNMLDAAYVTAVDLKQRVPNNAYGAAIGVHRLKTKGWKKAAYHLAHDLHSHMVTADDAADLGPLLRMLEATLKELPNPSADALPEVPPPQEPEFVRKLRIRAKGGNVEAQRHLGGIYMVGDQVSQDKKKGLKLIRHAAERGYWEAQFDMGRLYVTGTGVEKNIEEAAKWYRLAEQNGVSLAKYKLAKILLETTKDNEHKKSLKLLHEAARDGVADAQLDLGVMYLQGDKVDKNIRIGLEYIQKAAVRRSTLAQYNLGVVYARGIGVEQDFDKAHYWLQFAVKQGHKQAQKLLDEIDSR